MVLIPLAIATEMPRTQHDCERGDPHPLTPLSFEDEFVPGNGKNRSWPPGRVDSRHFGRRRLRIGRVQLACRYRCEQRFPIGLTSFRETHATLKKIIVSVP